MSKQPRRTRRYTPEERQQAILLYQGEWSTHEVERITGIPQSTVAGWLRREGIPRRNRRSGKQTQKSHAEIQMIFKLYEEEGYTQKEIGRMVGYHQTGISKILRRFGAKTRNRSEAMKHAYARGLRTA